MSPRLRLLFVILGCMGIAACQPEIGDSCSNASDCSVQDQRTCDTTLPGGYCTVFGCSADSCPSEGTCVGFQSSLSIAPECSSVQSRPRLQRTLCMRSCEDNGDCRDGYVCVDVASENPWAAVVLDTSGSGRICTLPPPPPPEGAAAVCAALPPAPLPPLDGGTEAPPDLPPLDAGADAPASPPLDAGADTGAP